MTEDNFQTRRRFVQGAAAGATMVGLAGCALGGDGGDGDGDGGGGDGDIESVRVPGLYDISGATSDVGRPTSIGSRDAIKWINENDPIDVDIDHNWVDYAYEVPQAKQSFDEFTSGSDPPIIIGWGTADTEALSAQVAEREIVYISASYSANLLEEDSPYNFFGNLDYTSQARVHLKWIADNDPGKVSFIFSNNPFGKAPVEGGKQYAEELGLEVGPDIDLPLTANSATTQLRKARDNDVDYLIHQNTAAPMQVLMKDRTDVYPEVTVCGLTYTVDELRVQQSPEVFEGARYVNAFKLFDSAWEGDGMGSTVIQESFDREGRSRDNVDVANLHYVRGVIHAMLAMKGIQNTLEAGDDPTAGANIRKGMFAIDGDDMGGLSQPYDYREGDRRPTMTGRTFVVADGELTFDTTIDLPRREDWIGL